MRSRFTENWESQSYFRLLNNLMFRAALPEDRFRIYEHFYRLPESLINRFYCGKLGWADRLRIMSGKPPVPIGSAVAAILRGHATT